jgi:filamentous hemagglutinin family protein
MWTTLRSACLIVLFCVLGFYVCESRAQAPPAPITSSGMNTQISAPNTLPSGQAQFDITGGTRPGGGTNIFHSFGNFNVPNQTIANFLNDSGMATSNILGRVTGGNISNIFGTIQTTGFGNANLFLMNPAGFLFGPNATVNVGGMVSFTSADYLRLEDNARFNAVPGLADALLTTAPVAAYGFLGSNPRAITAQGSQLSVTPGQSLSLVGGDIRIQSSTLDNGTVQSARLSAASGQINLASVASPGEILAGNLNQAPNINGASFGALGKIEVLEKSVIDASGDGGGTVLIRGGRFVIDDSRISANVTGPATGQFVGTPGQGIDIQVSQDAVIQNEAVLRTNVMGHFSSAVGSGGIRITADRIQIIGSTDFDTLPFTGIDSSTQGAGNSGNISLRAKGNIELSNLVFVQSSSGFDASGITTSPTRASGNAGDIELTSAHGNILMTNGGFWSAVTSQAFNSSGNTGNITMSAVEGNLVVDTATVFTYVLPIGSGNGGAVRLSAKNLFLNSGIVSTDNVDPLRPGGLTITVSDNLQIIGGSVVATSSESASGIPAGDISITAKDIVVSQGSFITSSTFYSGPGGHISLFADTVQLANGGQISSGSTFAPPFPGFDQGITPSGKGGDVTIQGRTGSATSVLIDGAEGGLFANGASGIFTNTEGTGTGGSINLFANSVTLQNGGTLSASTSGTAPSATGGTITVNSNTVNLASGGTMTAASSGPGASGEVVVQGLASPAQSLLIDGSGSGVFTNTSDTGAGGDVRLSANSVTVQNGGALSAVTTGIASSATGGTITVDAQNVALNTQGLITADTNGIAPAGVIDINTNTLAINSGGQIGSSSGAETEQVSVFALSSTAAPSLTGGTISIQGQSGNGSQANSVTIDGSGSGIFTESTGSRPGGDINLLTSQSVGMTNGAEISASSTGTGNAGNIDVTAGNLFAMTNSKMTTEANKASGGSIKVTTNPAATVELTNSTISASVLDGTGGGGSVDIDPQYVILQNSRILADAIFGPGGNIFITTNLLLPDFASVIRASSRFGQQGTISIQSPISPASGKINPIGQRPLIPVSMVSQRCAALAGGNVSSFTVAGRDSLPAEPGSWLPSPLALEDGVEQPGLSSLSGSFGLFGLSGARESLFQLNQIDQTDEIDQTNESLLSLRQIAPAGFLIQDFAPNGLTDCAS